MLPREHFHVIVEARGTRKRFESYKIITCLDTVQTYTLSLARVISLSLSWLENSFRESRVKQTERSIRFYRISGLRTF